MDTWRIQSLASSCAELFAIRLREQYQHAGPSLPAEEKVTLETQSARFNLWAENIGVFAEGNGSLDHRLAEHQDVARLVLGQLDTIQRHLSRLTTCEPETGDVENIKLAETLYDDDGQGNETDSATSAGDTSENESQTSSKNEEAPLALIVHAVHRLHRLSIAIRRSSSKTQGSKATQEQFIDEEGTDIVKIFEERCVMQILKRKFSNADDSLCKRLARGCADRRRKFLYLRRHQHRLKGKRHSSSGDQMQPTIIHDDPKTSFNVRFAEDSRGEQRESKPTFSVSKTNLTTTTASKFQRSEFRFSPSAMSSQSTVKSIVASTQITVESSFIPPPPHVAPGASEFLCPYCRKVQPAIERTVKRWKQHFLRDLEPYMCVVDDCAEAHECFSDSQKWLRHMESHGKVFVCHLHPTREGPQRFHNENDFDHHMQIRHASMSLPQRQRLKGLRSGGAKVEISTCPLCGWVPTQAPKPGASVANYEPAYKELLHHIANELHSIAMLSLLEADEIAESLPSEPSIRVADESTQAADNVSIVFDRDWKIDFTEWKDDDGHTHLKESEGTDFVPDGANPHDEWMFTNSRKPSYNGHENNKQLENFMRRLQLQKLLSAGGTVDPVLPCYQLPFRPLKNFHGRTIALDKLERELHPVKASKLMKTMTLTGPAGIGKTQLAKEFCTRYKNQYDVILWAHADQESKLANDFVEFAIALGFVGEDSPEAHDYLHCQQIVKAWLANPRKSYSDPNNSDPATWLLVFDHIIDPDTVNEFWPTGCKSGSILMTSRKALPWSETKYPHFQVQTWDSQDSAAFLERMIRSKSKNQPIRLGARARFSPVQLNFLAGIINLNQYSLQAFIDASQDDVGEETVMKLHLDDAKKNETDFAEWALESLSAKASSLLDVLSMFDPDNIVERMLQAPPDDICLPDYPRTAIEYNQAKEELMKYSIISKDKEKDTLTIQRLVQDAARRRMPTLYYREVFNSCVALLNDSWPYMPFTWRHAIDRWVKCEMLYPHIIRIRYFAERIDTTPEDIYGAFQFARLAVDAGWYCHERGRSVECEIFCTLAERVTNKLKRFLDNNPTLSQIVSPLQLNRVAAEIHMNRGCSASEVNKPQQTLESHKRFNEMVREELGNRDPETDMRLAISFNEMGVGYMMNEDPKIAEECFKRSEEEMERLDDYEPHKISLPLINRAACAVLDKRYAEAEMLLNQALQARIGKFGQNDTESFITGRIYQGLGNASLAQGLRDQSHQYFERAREQFKLTLGRGHHRTSDVAVALGRHYASKGLVNEAVEMFDKAVGVYHGREMYAPEEARVLFYRSQALRQLDKDRKADEDETNCLTLYRHLMPDDHRSLVELTDVDFNKHIVFWAR